MAEKSEVPSAWKDYLDDTLKVPDKKWDENKAKKYWGQLKNTDSRPKGWLMFPAPPAGAPDTFPFYNNNNASTAVPYYYNLLRSLSKESNYTGRTITEWLRHNKKPLHFYKNLDLDDTVYDNDSDDYVPSFLGRAAIVFKTDKASFIASNNNAKLLIKSIATYDTDSLEGKELMSYHNALLGEAQNVLNRIQARQSHAVNLKKQIIDREWRRFSDQNDYTYGSWDAGHQYVRSNKFLTIDRSTLRQLLNPSYNWTNDDYALFDSNIFNTITEGYREWQAWAERKKRQYLRECSEYFLEPKGFKYVAATEAVPLSMTKRVIKRTEYQLKKKARMMEPVKEEPMDSDDEEILLSEDKEEEQDEVEVVVNPEKPITVDMSDDSTDEDAESVMGDSSSGEETKQNSSTDYTETEAEDEEVMSPVKEETDEERKKRLRTLSQADLVAKRDALEKIEARSVKENNELKAIQEILKQFEGPCKNKINRRIANIKLRLKEGKWHIDENKNQIVQTGEKEEEQVTTGINEDGIKKLLITKDEKVGNELCTKDLKEFFQESVKKLLEFIKKEKRSINNKLDIKQLDERKKKLLNDFKIKKEVKKDVKGVIKFRFSNRLTPLSKISDMLRYGKFGSLTNKKDLNGGYSLKSEQNKLINTYAEDVRKEIMKAYKKEEVIKVNGKIEFNDGMASIDIKIGDKTYIMRILDRTMEEQEDHDNWLTAFEKYTKTKQPKHLLPLHIYRGWNVEGKVATFGKTETFNKTKVMDAFKLQFDQNFVEPKQSGEQKHVIYFQEKINCTDIRGWIERRYYALKQNNNGEPVIDEKKRKSIDRFSGELMGDDTKEEVNKEATMKIVEGVFEAIKEFHDATPEFAHRDVKIENFCIDGDKIYLIDFDNVLDVSKSTLNDTANIPMQNGQVFEDDDQLKIHNPNGILPTASIDKEEKGKILMDRYNVPTRMKAFLKTNPLAADLHQAGMAMLQLGGVLDWSCDYNWPSDPKNRYNNIRSGVFVGLNASDTDFNNAVNELHIIDFWRSLWEGFRKGASGTGTTIRALKQKVKNARVFIETLRKTKSNTYMAFNLHHSVVNEIGRKFFKTDKELVEKGFKDSGISKATNATNLQSPVITSPTQFMSTQRQPVFEKVSLESDFDDEDLEALMEFDPDVAELSDTSSPRSHISDAEFERMLHENDNYDMLTEHIVKENKAYNKKEIEEDARSIGSSNHSNASDVSIASQISNASNASNASAVSNASNISNLSASSEKSNISDMSNHSYMSNHSLESEEHYPTSEQSYHMSEVSYNQSSDNSYNSGTDSSSGKDMDYSHGISESSDHESSNESLGYSSSGNSSQNHSYNSSSDTE